MNKLLLIGRLGNDPEASYTTNGIAMTKFSLAVSRRGKGTGGEATEETEWFTIIAWRQLAEICNCYLSKGQKIYLEGRLTQRSYVDREGRPRIAVEVHASEMEMLTPKSQQHNSDDELDALLADLP